MSTLMKNDKTIAGLVDNLNQTAGTSITLEFIGIVGYAQDTDKPIVTIPFPFITKNTNYTVSVSRWVIDGKGTPSNISTLSKKNNSVTLVGDITATYLQTCPSSVIVTITFA